MAYLIDPEADTTEEVQRIARERIDDALARLDGLAHATPAEIEDSVHEVRKRCKELRGLARLIRTPLGPEFAWFNRTIRDAAVELSSIRDAHAVLATFENLQAAAGRQDDIQLERIRSAKAAAAVEATRSLSTDDARIRRARRRLAKGRKRLDRWIIAHGFGDLEDGLDRTYRRGRRGLRTVQHDPTDDNVHEWRKAVKNLWYQVRLLTPSAPSVLQPLSDRLHDLADALGDDHDLTVLVHRLEHGPDLGPAETAAAIELARHRQQELRTRALRLGATVYAESTGRFVRRMGAYWQTTVAQGPERKTGAIATLRATPLITNGTDNPNGPSAPPDPAELT